ncbi:MAG: crossover junction endodeoxyribonuclease RuvC [Saprospiraceae bacterium]|nr:crossover junction endodeoxyribonuclease RuvC [Saprospiraceae bacterium]
MAKIQEKYKILGIDPGTNILGYAIMEVDGSQLKIVTFGVIKLKNEKDHQTKLKEIFLQLQEIVETYQPKHLAIEAPFYAKNPQSLLKLGRAQGVAIAAGITMGLDITEYMPKKIKMSVTGNGNASKEQVSSMLEQLLKVKITTEYLDATDALAVAYCHYNQGLGVALGGKKYNDWSSFITKNKERVSGGTK